MNGDVASFQSKYLLNENKASGRNHAKVKLICPLEDLL